MIGGHKLYLYEGDMYHNKEISAFFTNVKGTFTNVGGYQLY